jgi:alpha-amylase/alpha-mannosidase (GH57 family)
MAVGSSFTHAQRLALLECIGGLVSDIIPRYRRLEAAGQIELSTTPYFHPLAPLLIDFGAARDVRPELPLPQAARYPDGAARVAWHVRAALQSHMRRFGRAPGGMWPAEGAVSNALLDEIARAGVEWAASGERVLANSLRRTRQTDAPRESYLYRPYRVGDTAPGMLCFFRDDRLSDLIGFEYRRWDGTHAAAHFVGELEAILSRNGTEEAPIVSVILDGENAWEHYPYNGYFFLSSLYERMSNHPMIRMSTYRDWMAEHGRRASESVEVVGHLRAGSWVYGDLTTWIGSHDKNAAWDLLVSAKNAYDLVIASGRLTEAEREAAEHQLAICESSDWFWWFGDYNAAHAVASFDTLYRGHLAELYRRLHLAAPASLAEPVSRGNASVTADGAMRRAV